MFKYVFSIVLLVFSVLKINGQNCVDIDISGGKAIKTEIRGANRPIVGLVLLSVYGSLPFRFRNTIPGNPGTLTTGNEKRPRWRFCEALICFGDYEHYRLLSLH